jgi:hypothetical protein
MSKSNSQKNLLKINMKDLVELMIKALKNNKNKKIIKKERKK